MKKVILALVIAAFAFTLPGIAAQEKGKSDEPAKTSGSEKPVTPLRVQVIFNEYNGDKKVSSLPYTLLVNADDRGPVAAIHMGLRVPIPSGSGGTIKQYQYQALGTNLDGRAEKMEEGRFMLKLNVVHNSVYTPSPTEKAAPVGGSELSVEAPPVIQEFSSQVNLLIHDGQTIQSTVATDPVTGHVLKVDVTMNVIK
jgi:hypothetical protein